jgi:hypothetical protein
MRTIGVIATVLVAIAALGVVALLVMSIPDIRRYLAIRRM